MPCRPRCRPAPPKLTEVRHHLAARRHLSLQRNQSVLHQRAPLLLRGGRRTAAAAQRSGGAGGRDAFGCQGGRRHGGCAVAGLQAEKRWVRSNCSPVHRACMRALTGRGWPGWQAAQACLQALPTRAACPPRPPRPSAHLDAGAGRLFHQEGRAPLLRCEGGDALRPALVVADAVAGSRRLGEVVGRRAVARRGRRHVGWWESLVLSSTEGCLLLARALPTRGGRSVGSWRGSGLAEGTATLDAQRRNRRAVSCCRCCCAALRLHARPEAKRLRLWLHGPRERSTQRR